MCFKPRVGLGVGGELILRAVAGGLRRGTGAPDEEARRGTYLCSMRHRRTRSLGLNMGSSGRVDKVAECRFRFTLSTGRIIMGYRTNSSVENWQCQCLLVHGMATSHPLECQLFRRKFWHRQRRRKEWEEIPKRETLSGIDTTLSNLSTSSRRGT